MVKSIATILTILFSTLAFAQEYRFYVEANKKKVPLGKTVQLTYRFQGARPQNFEPPQLVDFDFASYISQRSETNIVNNRVSKSIAFVFSIKPKKVGTFTIPPATVTVNGKRLKSDEITIKVIEQSEADKGIYTQIAENLFIKAYINKTDVYLGDQIKVTYKLFKSANMPIAELEYKSMPEYDGFWKEVLSDREKFELKDEVVDGIRYQTGVLESVILFPQKTGEIIIDPYVLHTKIPVKSRQRGYSIFDDFFGSYKYYDYDLSAPTLKVKVKELPTKNKPKDFSGLVGQLNFKAELTTTEAQLDDPVTLNLTVSGKGNLKLLKPWELDLPPGIEDYPVKTHDNFSRSTGSIEGTRRFELLMFPRREGIFKLPPVRFSYFDVEEEEYKVIEVTDLSFKVGKGENLSTITNGTEGRVPSSVKTEVDYLNTDIEFIKFNNLNLFVKGYSPFLSAPHIIFSITPFGLLFLMLFLKRKKHEAQKDVMGTRKKLATKQAKKRLKKAEALLNEQKDVEFYEEVAKAVFGFFRDKYSIAESELSKEIIVSKLNQAAIPEDLIKSTTSLIDECEFARFAPGDKKDKMNSIYNNAVNVISQIETIEIN
ncbi:MAG: BatD family protein [Bacteroidia bacterium]